MTGKVDRNLMYIMRSHTATCNPAAMEQFLQTFADRGYWLAAGIEQETSVIWDRRLYAAPDAALPSLQPGVSDLLRERVKMYLAGQRDDVDVFAYSTGPVAGLPGFLATFAFEEQEEGTISVSADGLVFTWGSAAEDVWEDSARLMYRLWHPLFAFSYFDVAGDVRIPRADVLKLRLPYLHRRMNFLGPELVDALGRERVLTTPGARIEVLDDGGVLLQPDGDARVKQHLGLAVVGVG